uniref:Uncharacterized protein n=1 Tax=Anguilla anguilla TaxID=7936 RepID=A0A0E9S647_ANGAN
MFPDTRSLKKKTTSCLMAI